MGLLLKRILCFGVKQREWSPCRGLNIHKRGFTQPIGYAFALLSISHATYWISFCTAGYISYPRADDQTVGGTGRWRSPGADFEDSARDGSTPPTNSGPSSCNLKASPGSEDTSITGKVARWQNLIPSFIAPSALQPGTNQARKGSNFAAWSLKPEGHTI